MIYQDYLWDEDRDMKNDFSDTRIGRRMAGRGEIRDFAWPENCGDIDLKIDRHGQWFYGGSPIGRIEICQLFASVLQCDEEGVYWLVTPHERILVEVEDVPFMAVDMDIREEKGKAYLYFRTNMKQEVCVDREHELRVDICEESDEPRPYVRIRKNLWARLTRSVFYRVVDHAELDEDECLYVKSGEERFELGRV